MKILITTGIFEPEIGGPAGYAPKLASGLVARGHRVMVITYSDKPKYDFDAEYIFTLKRVVRTKSKFFNYLHFFQAVRREAKKYDLIYSLDWFSAGIPVALAAKFAKKRYLLRIGGGYIWERYLNDGHKPVTLRDFYKLGYYKKYPVMRILMSYVLRGAHGIVFNTNVQRGFYTKYYGLSPRRLVTVFNPIPNLPDSRQRELFNGSKIVAEKEIIFAGRMTVKNNIENCIRAFKNETFRDYALTFIGDGFLVDSMRDLAKSLGLKNVRFLPSMRQEKLYERIKNCRYVILPSWTDISPNIVYECMALGVPFLVTKENYLSVRPQIPFMIDPRDVSDITRKMCLLAEDNAYKEYCNSLRNIKFGNSWDDVCDAHINIFQKCLGQ